MMRLFRLRSSGPLGLLTLTLLLLLGARVQAAEPVQELLRLSGLEAQLNESPADAAQVFAEQFKASSDLDIGQDFADMVERTLTQHSIIETVRTELSGALGEAEMQPLLSWYRSELGRRVTALEVAASQPEQIDRMAAQMNSLTSNTAAMAKARRLESLLQITEFNMVSMEATQSAIVVGILSAQEGGAAQQQMVLTQLKEGLQSARPEVEQFSLASAAFTYRALSAAEFDRYLEFLDQPATRRFNEQLQAAMLAGLRHSYGNLGQEIGAYLKSYEKVSQDTVARD